jgi:hypothetical protein
VGPYKVVNRINDVVYRIQRNPRSRMMVVDWTGSHLVRELLGMSSLKEGAVRAVGEKPLQEKKNQATR